MATEAVKSGYVTPDTVVEAVKKYDEAYKHHRFFVRDYDRSERAYQGILRSTSSAAKWRHTYTPKHAFNFIETIVANTVEMGLDLKVRPAPKPGLSMDDARELMQQTSIVRDLIKHEWMYDDMDRKQRPLFLIDAIGGRAVGKTSWDWTTGAVKRQGIQEVAVHDHEDNYLGSVPTMVEIEESSVLFDNSTTEICDPRDVIFHESAKDIDPRKPGGAQHVFHRSWLSMEQLREMQAQGFIHNVDYLTDTRDFSDEYSEREREIWNLNRAKDLVEVVERWEYRQGKVWRLIYGNRGVELRTDEANPFWHQKYPFFICSSQPQPFSLVGMSDMALIEQLQEMLWEVTNQSLDNLELINNAIMLIRSDVDDPDAFQYYPGAHWPVDNVDQVKALIPPYQVTNVSLERENLIKGDMQAVSSAAPLAGGSTSGAGPTTSTATGASLVMNAAQQRLASKKWQAQQGLTDEAWLRFKNCQQFISDERLLHTLGPSGKMSFRSMSPLNIQGEYLFSLAVVGEGQNKAERQATAQGTLQLMKEVFPLMYASGTPIDMVEVVRWYMREVGLEDEAASFFEPQTQPDPETMNLLFGNAPKVSIRANTTPGAADSALQATGSGGPPPGQMNAGTTAATAVDASSPSTTGGMSLSGQQFLQRAQALNGGAKGRV